MECSLASTYGGEQTKTSVSSGSLSSVKAEKSAKSGLHVNFTEKGEVKERREKFLTAKYGSHQMNLIRKRLAVEMWLYEEIQKLCSLAVSWISNFCFSAYPSPLLPLRKLQYLKVQNCLKPSRSGEEIQKNSRSRTSYFFLVVFGKTQFL